MNFEEPYEALAKANEKQSRFLSSLRFSIVQTQLADIGSRITHDPEVNVNDDLEPVEPRPFGSEQEEIHAFGHTFANLIMLAQNRGISPEELEEGFDHAVEALTDKDWKAREAAEDGIHGQVAAKGGLDKAGATEGYAAVYDGVSVRHGGRDGAAPVLVIEHFRPEHVHRILGSSMAYRGIVTDHGGMTSHAATVAREQGYVCIVGTGNATDELEPGDPIRLNLTTGEVEIRE